MPKKYLIIIIIIVAAIVASLILWFVLKPAEKPIEKIGIQEPEKIKKIAEVPTTASSLIKEEPKELSKTPLPEIKPEIKQKLEKEKKEEVKKKEEIQKSLFPSYPIFNADGKITELKENGFIIETKYGNFNAVFTENTSTFESRDDLMPTKGKTGLYLLKKGDSVAISVFESLNTNQTVTASTVRIIK